MGEAIEENFSFPLYKVLKYVFLLELIVDP